MGGLRPIVYKRSPSLSTPARDAPFNIDRLELDTVRIRETEYDLVITGKGSGRGLRWLRDQSRSRLAGATNVS
jgi:hypothetical protein